MKTISALFLVILLAVSVTALEEVATDSGSFSVNSGSGDIVIEHNKSQSSFCGNNLVESSEQCDGSDINGELCSTLISGSTGTLSCKSDCVYDTSQCVPAQINTNGNNGGGNNGGGGSGNSIGSFQVIQAPPICIENWECTDWTDCGTAGAQSRTCTDLNNCTTILLKPDAERLCEEQVLVEEQGNFLSRILGAVIGVGGDSASTPVIFSFILGIIVAMLILYAAKKDKTASKEAEISVDSANVNSVKKV